MILSPFYLRYFLSISLIVVSCLILIGQSPGELLTTYSTSHHREKVYVSTDRNYYLSGETIWLKIFHISADNHQVFDAEPIVYLDWVNPNGEIVNSYTTRVKAGSATMDIKTNGSDEEGVYYIRAYTLYQKNFDESFIFQKEVSLLQDNDGPSESKKEIDKSEIRLYPEGGALVEELTSRVAFSASGISGPLNAWIEDDLGNRTAPLELSHEDRGLTSFTPMPGRTYDLKYLDGVIEKSTPVTGILKTGLSMRLNPVEEGRIEVLLAAHPAKNLKDSRIVGHLRGNVFMDMQVVQEGRVKLSLDTRSIPSGILHFTLFDKNGLPFSERLVFNKNPQEQVNVELSLDGELYGPRSLVSGSLDINRNGKRESAELSMSVYKSTNSRTDSMNSNILNYLWLQSELGAHIKEIHQYFLEHDQKSEEHLDLLLMTQGWRRFNWLDVLAERRPDLQYPAEVERSLVGRVSTPNGKKPVRAEVSLNILNEGSFSMSNYITEEDGLFVFEGLDFRDTTDLLVQAEVYNERKKRRLKKGETKRTGRKNVSIELIRTEELPLNRKIGILLEDDDPAIDTDLTSHIRKQRLVDSIYNPAWSLQLEEFTVRALKKTDREIKDDRLKERYRDIGLPFFESSVKVYMDDLPADGAGYTNIYDIIRNRVPGAEVYYESGVGFVILRGVRSITGSTFARIMVNGMFTDEAFVSAIHPANVLAIDVMSGLYASAIFGENGRNGVISITTKRPEDRVLDRVNLIQGILNYRHPGYYNARTFAAPDYGQPSSDHNKPDYRRTLFWDGSLKTDGKPISFHFYTGDEPGPFTIRLEGITEGGVPFVEFGNLNVGSQ